MRGVGGFAFGSLALIVLYTVLQSEASGRVAEGGGAALGLFRRVLDGGIAGIPNKAKSRATWHAPPSSGGGGGHAVPQTNPGGGTNPGTHGPLVLV
jgi:hypothetical protein